jgi:hypothetical protein
MRFEFVELVDSLTLPSNTDVPTDKLAQPSVLVITKAGKYLRGHIVDHNVRINSDGKVRGRIVFLESTGQKKDVDANDIVSLEKIKGA